MFETIPFIDIFIIAIVILSGILGFYRGVTQEALGIAGWVGAVFVTLYSFTYVDFHAQQYMNPPLLASSVAVIGIFLTSLLVFSFTSKTLGKSVKSSNLGSLDRSLGLLFGFTRGLFIMSLLYLLLASFFTPTQWPWLTQTTRMLPVVQSTARFVMMLAPSYMVPDALQTSLEPEKGPTASQEAETLSKISPIALRVFGKSKDQANENPKTVKTASANNQAEKPSSQKTTDGKKSDVPYDRDTSNQMKDLLKTLTP
ncbi:MAG: CvpA family protein [Alphaproteobacteria bacterium]|jgi:membrane protein required for colicin V production|nr:CvpA family protein [Alphaproteobacteria bacterium]MBT5389169.1 CvpA family protein [Alphaproteobacteria bacterium]MBT5540098.1 CvpA family protein [Alphaproteobacteria bacterium]MBT5654897.1 CvpA family protein [Alphaproteobacteria bacterium]